MRYFSRTGKFPGSIGALRIFLVGALAISLGLMGAAGSARADSLQQLIEQVGPVYGEAYSSPFIHAFGPNQNTNLFTTAKIPYSGLGFGIGIKGMGTNLNEDDQTFQKVVRVDNLGDFIPELEGISGNAIMSGPTIFGDTETTGRIDLFARKLIETNLSISEIADSMGFDTDTNISRLFQKYHGMTPFAYRRRHAAQGGPRLNIPEGIAG